MEFKDYTEDQKKIYVGDCHKVATIVESFGFKTHLQFGALLGYVREGKLIDTDTDLDLCVMSNESKPEIVVWEMSYLFNKLKDVVSIWRYFDEKGMRKPVTEIERPFGQIFITTNNKNIPLPVIDLAVSWVNNGDYWQCCWGNLFKYEGLQKISFYGYDFNIPVNPGLLLDKIYGEDWMTPKLTKANHRITHSPVLYNLINGK
jgi:hypothetical protein